MNGRRTWATFVPVTYNLGLYPCRGARPQAQLWLAETGSTAKGQLDGTGTPTGLHIALSILHCLLACLLACLPACLPVAQHSFTSPATPPSIPALRLRLQRALRPPYHTPYLRPDYSRPYHRAARALAPQKSDTVYYTKPALQSSQAPVEIPRPSLHPHPASTSTSSNPICPFYILPPHTLRARSLSAALPMSRQH
jgi:hypothetical protein